VHLDDTVDALVRAASRADGLVVNVASGGVVRGSDVVAVLTGLGTTVELAAPVAGPTVPALDNGRAQIHLGWTPFTPLATGLESVLSG
jgi:nucleoside-diphosphate-sugar epimerase